MKVSLVIPAYNEAERIKPTLGAYRDYFAENFPDFEFIVMIEGNDNTPEVVNEFSKKDRRIKSFYSKERLGKGGATIRGFGIADGDYIGFVDADGSTKPEAFGDLIKELQKHDGAIASRKIRGAKLIVKEPMLQRFGSRGFNTIVRLLFMLPFRDTQCGAKIFRKDALHKALPHLTLANFAFDIDLLYVMKILGFKISEVPTVWEYKAGAQFNFGKWFWKLVPNMFMSLIRLRLVHSRLAKFIKPDAIYGRVFGKRGRK